MFPTGKGAANCTRRSVIFVVMTDAPMLLTNATLANVDFVKNTGVT